MAPAPAFLPPTPARLSAPRRLAAKAPLTLRGARSTPTSSAADDPPATQVRNPSRRALLGAAAAAALSAALPPLPSLAEKTTMDPVTRDFLYESTSGSFLPPSALQSILRHGRSGRLYDRCVVAAEIHDNMCTHAAQLATLHALNTLDDDRPLVVGFEQFYREHNPLLNAFVEGDLSLVDLLKRTEWPSTWGFDPMLYVPLFLYCRQHGIAMRGLNAPLGLATRVASVGIQGLSRGERAALPGGMDMSNSAHFSHFCDSMAGAHHTVDNPTIARMYQVQVLWEEWMSESVSRELESDPSARMLVLVGCGHVEKRFGLPDRIERRSSERPYTILPVPVNWAAPEGAPLEMPDITLPARDAADLVWYTRFDNNFGEGSKHA